MDEFRTDDLNNYIDSDDGYYEEDCIEYSWTTNIPVPIKNGNLLITSDEFTHGFVENCYKFDHLKPSIECFLNGESKIGQTCLAKRESLKAASVYNIDGNSNYLIFTKPKLVPQEHLVPFVEKILSFFTDVKSITLLHSESLSSYRRENDDFYLSSDHKGFTCSVFTDAAANKSTVVTKLPFPNLIYGIPAQFMTSSQIGGIFASLHVLFVNKRMPSVEDFDDFVGILGEFFGVLIGEEERMIRLAGFLERFDNQSIYI